MEFTATLTVQAHSSASYAPRTYVNAQSAELTVAFAIDFSTAGERLTHKAAADGYLGISFGCEPIEAARILYRELRKRNARSINIAGNGIYTLAKSGWRQQEVNQWVYEVLAQVSAYWPLTMVRSGGQTGIDIAGVAAAHALGITALTLLPRGFLQRGEDKIDKQHTADEIKAQIAGYAQVLALGNSSTATR